MALFAGAAARGRGSCGRRGTRRARGRASESSGRSSRAPPSVQRMSGCEPRLCTSLTKPGTWRSTAAPSQGLGEEELVGGPVAAPGRRLRRLEPGVDDPQGEVVADALRRIRGRAGIRCSHPSRGRSGRPRRAPVASSRASMSVGEFPNFVAPGGRVAPAETAQVRADHPAFVGQRRNHLAPGPPVLRPAVEQEDRRALPRFGDVQSRAGDLDVAMSHTVELWRRSVHRQQSTAGKSTHRACSAQVKAKPRHPRRMNRSDHRRD